MKIRWRPSSSEDELGSRHSRMYTRPALAEKPERTLGVILAAQIADRQEKRGRHRSRAAMGPGQSAGGHGPNRRSYSLPLKGREIWFAEGENSCALFEETRLGKAVCRPPSSYQSLLPATLVPYRSTPRAESLITSWTNPMTGSGSVLDHRIMSSATSDPIESQQDPPSTVCAASRSRAPERSTPRPGCKNRRRQSASPSAGGSGTSPRECPDGERFSTSLSCGGRPRFS